MHRATPLHTSFRAYTSGGARSAVHEVDDGYKMQLGKANGMKNETRERIESPQNYGFSSVVADGDKGPNNSLTNSAEQVISFIGGNRSFPMGQSMDDRRHRLWNLAKDAAKGASSVFGLKEWGQQLLNTDTGQYLTGNVEKLNRFQLVENKNGQKQQATSQSKVNPSTNRYETIKFVSSYSGVEFEIEVVPPVVSVLNADGTVNLLDGGGNGGGDSQQGQQQPTSQSTGQKTLHKEESTIWIEQNKKDTQCTHGDANSRQRASSDSTVFYGSDNSCQSTDGHSHIMGAGVHIWVAGGCFSDMPIIVKRDGLCKAR
jgi:phage gp45-like